MSDGFLSRWSRLKRGGETPPEPVAEVEAPVVPVSPEAPPEFDITTLPDIETATAETDFTAFLQKGVPAFLKRQALRRAWTLDPGIRDFIGPADYAWDFNAEGGVPGFSLSLGGDVAKLLAQAIGQIDRVAEALPETPDFLPPGVTVGIPAEAGEAAPEEPLRLAPSEDLASPEEPESMLRAEPVLARRHGGATPV